jgi:hypothetical protein
MMRFLIGGLIRKQVRNRVRIEARSRRLRVLVAALVAAHVLSATR